ncbi:Mitochondrial import receptor subunit TOM20 [Orchesella cincta]|uniref:Mitochondrial import receptor subunit TOM20 n=1 Tax=Orchesella cincta TaxID=48709 RepID=A0A1D2MZY2_ORCCI|nr:Mitochondrial import receptor subunit TOM20 [Orchesella cincta]
MLNLTKSAWGIAAAGLSGLLIVGYCIYFDQKRRNDPNFKKKLRERRKQKRLAKTTGCNMPDLRDQEAVQKFFLSEVQLGEDLLSQGDVEGAVEHLGSAIAVCGHPQQLLQILQQTLPPQVFHRLLQRLPMIGQAVRTRQMERYGDEDKTNPLMSASEGPMITIGMGAPGISLGAGGAQPSVLAVDDELE